MKKFVTFSCLLGRSRRCWLGKGGGRLVYYFPAPPNCWLHGAWDFDEKEWTMCRVPSYDTQATATWEVLRPNATTANCSQQEALWIRQGHNYTSAKGKSFKKKKKRERKKEREGRGLGERLN